MVAQPEVEVRSTKPRSRRLSQHAPGSKAIYYRFLHAVIFCGPLVYRQHGRRVPDEQRVLDEQQVPDEQQSQALRLARLLAFRQDGPQDGHRVPDDRQSQALRLARLLAFRQDGPQDGHPGCRTTGSPRRYASRGFWPSSRTAFRTAAGPGFRTAEATSRHRCMKSSRNAATFVFKHAAVVTSKVAVIVDRHAV